MALFGGLACEPHFIYLFMQGSWLEGCPDPSELSFPLTLLWFLAGLLIPQHKVAWVLEIRCVFDGIVMHI